jgi:hypothetical protein
MRKPMDLEGEMTSRTKTPADELRSVSMGAVWGVAFVVVVIFCGLLTPWDALLYLLANQGVGDEGAWILAFVAGYTLPLTFGTALIAFLFLRGFFRGHGLMSVVLTTAVVLAGSGWLAQALGLEMLPDYSGVTWAAEYGLWGLLGLVLGAYVNGYGWALAVSATVIGFACGMHVERWVADSAAGES